MTNITELNHHQIPELLREVFDAPKKLYLKGHLEENQPRVAIVGTRKATGEGLRIAEEFAGELGKRGVVVVSGLALGIDSAAHRGAIASGAPTIAVLANGLNKIYPRTNEALAKNIISSGGAIISEYSVDTPAYPNQFIARNRIISGLSLGVIIIESPKKSGAKATARFALEQNREVFVVPGPMRHPNYEGSHELIKEGAALVTSASDVLSILQISKTEKRTILSPQVDNNQTLKLIVEAMQDSGGVLSSEELIQKTGLDSKTINSSVTILLVEGVIKESGGRFFCK